MQNRDLLQLYHLSFVWHWGGGFVISVAILLDAFVNNVCVEDVLPVNLLLLAVVVPAVTSVDVDGGVNVVLVVAFVIVIVFVEVADDSNVDISGVEVVPLVEDFVPVVNNVDVVVILSGGVPQSLLFSSSFNGQSTMPSQ